jgi:hypothetical protein
MTAAAASPAAGAPLLGDISSGDEAEDIRQTARQLLKLDRELGGAGVAEVAMRLHWRTQGHLGDRSDREMVSAAAEVAEVAGWTSFDAEQLDQARLMILESVNLARSRATGRWSATR